MTIAWIALGSNATSGAGGPAETLIAAAQQIQSDSCDVFLKSRLFRTKAFPAGSGPDFVNAAIGVDTSLEAPALLEHLHDTEAAFGRVRRERWAQRVLDLDLLSFGDEVLPDVETYLRWHDLPFERQKQDAPDQMILPHPRLHERGFVLIPLNDIAPDWRHPVLGQTVSEMLEGLPEVDKAEVEAVDA